MIVRVLPLILAALVVLPTAPARAQATDDNPLLGTWEIVEAAPAPWTAESERAALAAEGKRLLKLVVTFAPSSISSRHPTLTCKSRVLYEPTEVEPDALFQGNLPEPNPTAAAVRMGFPRKDIPGVDVRCVNGAFAYHFRDRDTALTALNNVIYTFKRR